jgi:RNA 2',3'-cyclic 3'-phosphodiesterase
VDPPPAAHEHLMAALAALRGCPGAPRWSEPARWHLTLLFLGTVPAATVPGLVEAVGPAVAAAGPLRLRLAGAGRFGSRRRPQVAWIGLDGDVAGVTELAARLAAAARRLGLAVEDRPFRPHLTVGRWRPGHPADAGLMDRLAGYRGPDWPVREVHLVQSFLGPKPRHELVEAWPFGG